MSDRAQHINQVVLKVTQRCNLACEYCYMYNRGDDSWRSRPAFISDVVAQRLADRIREQGERHHDRSFTVEIHGGEPLLLGRSRMQRLIDVVRAGARPVEVVFTLQTNGMLLDHAWLELFAANRISFGLSLDGPPEVADRYRVRRSGAGSTEHLLGLVRRLRAESDLFDQVCGGCLCVVDPSVDGAYLVDWFTEQGFRSFDFLLPDGNVANPPDGWSGAEPYRRFLREAFDRWYTKPAPVPRIRLFELMMLGLMGSAPDLDALGGDLKGLCVVESDGSLGLHDVLRMCGPPFDRDVLTVFDDPFDRLAPTYRIDELQATSEQCRACRYLDACGGGFLPHRFDGTGFANPSLYCDALYALAERMEEVLRQDLPAVAWVDDRAACSGGA